ncbi:2,5-didehydrogluconate reductase DkgB [Fangia hongkongensis]|uniref:2,5-didehydrogluconate reductase DkgB n=1 Tax=Fangia hongkongensis TaxID=270495 RepID=UPI00037D1C6A|nr:2,5-didehydrogluconate reductase DkgB [Fangia hongkongensis]MBK2124194.1 2,5-didehydrogluconate reductase DkgB [Fangia hongkongensis]
MHQNIIPMLGAGTFRLKEQEAYQSVEMSLEAGYRHIDTAQIYDNESEVGKAIADSGIKRDDIFLVTKVWMSNFPRDRFRKSVEESLQKLRTQSVDLLLIHWPLRDDNPPMADYLESLKQVQEAGLTKHIGVSNFTVSQLEQAIDILGKDQILTNQIEVHPYLRNKKVTDCCQQNNIIVTAYMPFAYGKVLSDPLIQKIAQNHDATAAQVVLAWEREHGFVTIPSSTKRKNLDSNLLSKNVHLSANEVSEIDGLNQGFRLADPDFAPDWDI